MIKRFILRALLIFPIFAVAGAAGFSYTDIQGRNHTLAGYQGKWVLLNLWSTAIPSSMMEIPELEALSKSRKDLVVLGLAVDGQNPRKVAQFVEKLTITYPIIAGNQKQAKQFDIRSYPTSILYDPSGKQVLVHEGTGTRKDIESILNGNAR
jgi:thiol-disulfide isomerase/thioredoxin